MKLILALTLLAFMSGTRCLAADGRLVLPDFHALEESASETVSINLDSALLRLAAGFLDDSKPEDAAVKELVAGLTGVYVKTFTFDTDFAYPRADIDRLRKQLSAPGWQPLVEVRSRKEQTNVDIYISMERGRANGLAVIASEPREFTIVNIVGPIDLQRLHQLEGRFGIPALQLEKNAQEAD